MDIDIIKQPVSVITAYQIMFILFSIYYQTEICVF
jgi:hypothetical protein